MNKILKTSELKKNIYKQCKKKSLIAKTVNLSPLKHLLSKSAQLQKHKDSNNL